MPPVTISYLEMTSPSELRPKRPPETSASGVEIRAVDPPDFTVNRRFYCDVGGPWKWTDRLVWGDERWRRQIERPEIATWMALLNGVAVGYAELEKQPGDNVEISYFGLLPEFLGKNLGGWFLSETIRRAWEMDAARVWVHTCTLDHPAALANYLARGFQLYQTETK